ERASLEAEIPRLQRDLADAFLKWKGQKVAGAIETAKKTLGELQRPLAELLAFESLQQDLLGSTFQTGRGGDRQALASGTVLTKALLESLPPKLATDQLEPEALNSAAASILATLKREI